jgi:hypothetical protein
MIFNNLRFWRECLIIILITISIGELVLLCNLVEEPLFIRLSKQLATSHKYDIDNYNCENFSIDLVKLLKENGYDAYTITGHVNCTAGYFNKTVCEDSGGLHEWVEVKIPIEATAGQIIEPDVYRNVYNQPQ